MELKVNLSQDNSHVTRVTGDREFYHSLPQILSSVGVVFNLKEVERFLSESLVVAQKEGRSVDVKELFSTTTDMSVIVAGGVKALVEIAPFNAKGITVVLRLCKEETRWVLNTLSVSFNHRECHESVRFLQTATEMFGVEKVTVSFDNKEKKLTVFALLDAMSKIRQGLEELEAA